ncbi:MAG: FAD-dependent oxidoreductase, partial [Candidatus Krumholzibacteriota bacterium]
MLGDVKRAVVVGGGYIGLEFAVSLAHMGKAVTLVELLPHVMGGRIDPEMAAAMENNLGSLGIDVRLDAMVERIEGQDGRVTGVTLAGGEHLAAEAVLSAVGVKPLVGYADALGLKTGPAGILVDDYFRTNQPDIYALGDCTQTFCRVTGREVPGKLGSNAGQMARHLALNLLDYSSDPYPGVINSAITRLGGLAYGSAGLTEADAAAAGIEVLVGRNRAADRYANMPDPQPVDVKVIYRADDQRLIGGEIMGRFNPAGFVETLAQLIEREMTLTDVLTASYSSHPELTPKTNSPYWIWASEPLFFKLQANPVATMGGSR